jgi:60 kDa SS-A/Ro ribonucleoprotein
LKQSKDKLGIINNFNQKMAATTSTVNDSFVFQLSLKDYILRMLILGTRKNRYDQRTSKLSQEDIDYINAEIKAGHGKEICDIVAEVYKDSRAPKQDITLMVLALICRAEDVEVRQMGLRLIEQLRTISHLYTWKNLHALVKNPVSGESSKGFGRAVKRHINNWILSHQGNANGLAYQITKYMAREGWSFKNILQCTHVCTKTGDDRDCDLSEINSKNKGKGKQHDIPPTELDLVLRYAVDGIADMTTLAKKSGLSKIEDGVYAYINAVHAAKHLTQSSSEVLIQLIYKYRLTREQVPTWGLADTEVLTALLLNRNKTRVTMPLTALLRNLGNLTTHRVFADETTVQVVIQHLLNYDNIRSAHIHPVSVLIAWFTYRKGTGNHGRNIWLPNQQLVKTLEEMFYLSFNNVKPTEKRICFLIDCSGSMNSESLCEGVTNAEAAALLAMVFARSERNSEEVPSHSFYLFTNANLPFNKHGSNKSRTGLTEVTDVINDTATLDTVLSAVQRSDWGNTDISLGILDALKFRRKFDAFVVITDNDVNSGIKPSDAMRQYRDGMKMPKAKLAVVATQGTSYTIADPEDPNMMDMCGFDSHGPKILQEFIRA